MTFCLKGSVNYDVGSCHDSRTVKIEKWFDAHAKKQAIAKAKVIIQGYHLTYSHLTDYAMSAALHSWDSSSGTTIKKIWEIRWQDAQPYVPLRPAQPARKAGFRSRRFN